MIKDYDRLHKPVAMFEYNADAQVDIGRRKARFWANVGTSSLTLPMVMVNSGRELTYGSHDDYKKKYGGMIGMAMAERPTAEVKSWYKRAGLDTIHVQVDVKNIGSVALDPYADKPAQVVLFLVEDIELVHMTKTARAVAYVELPDELKPGDSIELEGDLTGEKGTNYNKSKVVAVLEYGDDKGWDLAGGGWATAGERPVAVPPTATEVPPPTATFPPIVSPPTQRPTEVPPTDEPTAVPAPTRFFGYLPAALFNGVLGGE